MKINYDITLTDASWSLQWTVLNHFEWSQPTTGEPPRSCLQFHLIVVFFL